jgi:deoxycytidine triphosphate deaminase
LSAAVGAALLASLRHRARSLGDYLDTLLVESGGANTGLRSVLQLFVQYSRAVQSQAAQLTDDPDPAGTLLALFAHLREVEDLADSFFARGHAIHVPRSLVAAVRRELQDLGLGSREPVLVLGPPQNFETFVDDLHDYLFARLDLVEQPPEPKSVAVITLPYMEGTRALWQPVTVGHEVAHLAVAEDDVVTGLQTDKWIDQSLVDRSLEPQPDWLHERGNPLQQVRTALRLWVTEILCDLQALRRWGPAGAAAVAEFLISIGAYDHSSDSHPPGWLRIHCLMESLGSDAVGLEPAVEAWRPFAAPPSANVEVPLVTLLSHQIQEHLQGLREAAEQLPGEPYDWRSREEVVSHIRNRLSVGIPGAERVGDCDVTPQDVVNAGWLARAGAAAEMDSEPQAQVLQTLDDLVSKALDTLDFLSLWNRAVSDAAPLHPEPAAAPPTRENQSSPTGRTFHGAVLSAQAIEARLDESSAGGSCHEGKTLTVTPRMKGAAQGTGLDVRLSTQFIVFRRSSTATFDALDTSQSPQNMQEWVEKEWGGQFILHPGELVLAATLEYIVMPSDLTAQVITRSSYGRLGLLSATAVQVHPHFKGCLTLELVNLGQMPLTLAPGERVAQLVFQAVAPPATPPWQKYEFPVGPQFSRVGSDPDVATLLKMRQQ